MMMIPMYPRRVPQTIGPRRYRGYVLSRRQALDICQTIRCQTKIEMSAICAR